MTELDIPAARTGGHADDTPAWCYDEDGYCIRCGRNRGRLHTVDCELRDLIDAAFTLRPLLAQLVDLADGTEACDGRNWAPVLDAAEEFLRPARAVPDGPRHPLLRPRCVRCGQPLHPIDMTLTCRAAPDGGAHEVLNPPTWIEGDPVRRGSSLHIESCERSNPSIWIDPPCTCHCPPDPAPVQP